MRFRFGLLLGFAIGYVLGSKAGQERYQQIRTMWGSVSHSEPAQQFSAEAKAAATRAGEAIEHKATEGVSRVTNMVRRGDGGDATGDMPGATSGGSIPPA